MPSNSPGKHKITLTALCYGRGCSQFLAIHAAHRRLQIRCRRCFASLVTQVCFAKAFLNE